jgi:hypothetical protein
MINDVRLTPRLVAFLVVLCVAIGPVVLDTCVLSCDAAAVSGRESTPACHHLHSTARTHLNATPIACGHDHHLLAATTTSPRSVRGAHRADASTQLALALHAEVGPPRRVVPRARSHCPTPDALRLTVLRV